MNANNPSTGTGDTPSVVDRIASILDSETATIQDSGVEQEDVSASTPFDDFDDASPEQTETVSEDATAEADNAEPAEVEPTASALSDDTKITLGDETLTLKDLKDGYMMRATFTQKTQELAELRTKYEAHQTGLDEVRLATLADMDHFQQMVLQAILPPVPNWKELSDNDQAEFVRQQGIWNEYRQRIGAFEQATEQMRKDQQARDAETFKSQREEMGRQLVTRYPELMDKATGSATQREFGNFLTEMGFTQQDIEQVTDHRMMFVAMEAFKASRTSKQTAAAVKRVESKPPLTPPGTAATKVAPARTAYENDLARLKKTGSRSDGIRALKHLL